MSKEITISKGYVIELKEERKVLFFARSIDVADFVEWYESSTPTGEMPEPTFTFNLPPLGRVQYQCTDPEAPNYIPYEDLPL